MVEWSRPGASLAVFAGLTLFLVVAAHAGGLPRVLVVLATMAPGAILSVERRAARAKRSARCGRAAKKCKDAEASLKREAEAREDADRASVLTRAAARVELRGARGRRRGRPRGRDERGRAAGGDAADPLIDPEEVTIWTRLRALLKPQSPGSSPSSSGSSSSGAALAGGRRARRAWLGRRLGATWAGGPLWRRSTAWRRHFACVRRGELQFWYSASHALAGVSPVLVVSLDNARVRRAGRRRPARVDLARAPEIAPAEHREWRLAAAHCRDADALRRCVCREASFAGDSDDRPVSPALSGCLTFCRGGLCACNILYPRDCIHLFFEVSTSAVPGYHSRWTFHIGTARRIVRDRDNSGA